MAVGVTSDAGLTGVCLCNRIGTFGSPNVRAQE